MMLTMMMISDYYIMIINALVIAMITVLMIAIKTIFEKMFRYLFLDLARVNNEHHVINSYAMEWK